MKKTVSTLQAPTAIGAYSQAVIAGETIYVSGQLGLDPDTMELVSGDFLGQAKQVLKNLEAIALAAESSLNDAVKLTVYLTDLSDFSELNLIMAEYMNEPFSARAAVEVSALPKGALLEIDAILYTPK